MNRSGVDAPGPFGDACTLSNLVIEGPRVLIEGPRSVTGRMTFVVRTPNVVTSGAPHASMEGVHSRPACTTDRRAQPTPR